MNYIVNVNYVLRTMIYYCYDMRQYTTKWWGATCQKVLHRARIQYEKWSE
jgi:hypothetical protein